LREECEALVSSRGKCFNEMRAVRFRNTGRGVRFQNIGRGESNKEEEDFPAFRGEAVAGEMRGQREIEERRKDAGQENTGYGNTSDQLNNHFTEMCSGSEAGSYLRLIDFVYHSTLGVRVIKRERYQRPAIIDREDEARVWEPLDAARDASCFRV